MPSIPNENRLRVADDFGAIDHRLAQLQSGRQQTRPVSTDPSRPVSVSLDLPSPDPLYGTYYGWWRSVFLDGGPG